MEVEWGAYYVVKKPDNGIPTVVKVHKPVLNRYNDFYVAIDSLPTMTGSFMIDDSGRILLAIEAWISHKASSLEIELT